MGRVPAPRSLTSGPSLATAPGDDPAHGGQTIEALLDDSPLTSTHRRVWLLSAMGMLLDGFDFFIMGVALPLITRDLGAGSLAKGLISAAAVLGAVVGAVVVGRLTDRLGRSLVFKLDLALFVLFAIGSALAPSIAVLVVFRFLLGMAIGADYPISAAYVPRSHRCATGRGCSSAPSLSRPWVSWWASGWACSCCKPRRTWAPGGGCWPSARCPP